MSKSFDVKIIVTTRAVFGEKELDAIRETCKVSPVTLEITPRG